jgi:hypothetical protein
MRDMSQAACWSGLCRDERTSMSITVCLAADTLDYPQGGGHFWVYLNWALGFRAAGCRLIWLELVEPDTATHTVREWVAALKHRLERYGLADSLALWQQESQSVPPDVAGGCLGLEDAAEADLLVDIRYDLRPEVVGRFRRSAMLDIDPGELQIWLSKGEIELAPHSVYFSIGETVGRPGARFPDAGIEWHYTPPCVALDWWAPRWCAAGAPFTTVAHWYDGWMEDDGGGYIDGKRSAFMPFIDLPLRAGRHFELALDLVPEDEDQQLLWRNGWRVRESAAVAATPWEYQRYIQDSRGEFSCAKLHCIRLQNAWISDRTLCYLASGKPGIVQHTGPSRFLPDCSGLFRFRDPDEAARYVQVVLEDYDKQCCLARALAEEHFDARKVVPRMLERALA